MIDKPTYQDLENKISEFKLLFDTIKEGIYSTNRGHITNVNKAFCDLFGYTRNELIGMPSWNLAKTELQNEVRDGFIQRLQIRDNSPIETTCVRKNGEFFLAEISISFLTETSQNFGVVRDMSDKIQKEQELIKAKEEAENNNRINEARLKLIQYSENHSIDEILEETLNIAEQVNQSKIGFFHFVHEDQNTLILQNWSTQTKNTYCKAEGKGSHYPIDKAGVWVDCVYERKPVIHNNYETLTHKKGLPANHAPLIRQLVVPIIYDETIKAILGIGNKETDYNQTDVENISLLAYLAWEIVEKKRISLSLVIAKEKAEESDRLKTAFLQNMSHEIRTPLNAISGFSGMLNKPELSEEKRKSFVSIIQNSSNQLISIVSDILTISSLETKQEKTNINKVCINNIIVDLLSIFKQQALNQNISLYAKQQLNDKQSEIFSDKTKITQILTNLLTNALKFTHEGFIEFGYNLKETELEFYVKDSGIGIKTELHEKIFERFRQADKSINKLYGGTGLGLAISKSFTDLLGGKIWVQSEIEKGSTFYFTVPYKPVNEIDKITTPTRQNENFKTILVAEDEEYNFLFLEELLIDMDLKIIHAKDGKETVEICKTNSKIDLILMDIKMPIMTGDTAAKLIKEFRQDLIIIAQSAYGLEQELERYSGIFDDYVTKPIKENELKEKLLKYINK